MELAELPRYIPDAQRVIQMAITGKTQRIMTTVHSAIERLIYEHHH